MPAPRAAGAFAAVRVGDRGPAVREIRERLRLVGRLAEADSDNDDEVFDDDVERAVRGFQQQRSLSATGEVDRATFRALEEASWTLGDRVLVHLAGSLMTGDDVFALQRRLLDLGFSVGRLDGRFGHGTERAVKEFQRNIGLPPDGTCGPATLKALQRLAPLVQGGSPNALRAEERIRMAGPQLAGKVVVVDAGGASSHDPALAERAARITIDLARRVEGRLVATGVQAYLVTSGAQGETDEAERAEFANRAEAHLCVSLHLDTSRNPGIRGVSTSYFGVEQHGIRSSVGERFAGLVQREIVARTDLPDLRSHARAWDLLRSTRMPAVRVDVGYISNPTDAERLADPAFRDTVAEAVVVAVQRLYLAPETDAHTGMLDVAAIRELRHSPR